MHGEVRQEGLASVAANVGVCGETTEQCKRGLVLTISESVLVSRGVCHVLAKECVALLNIASD
jgi:hypothetical protein